MPTQIMTQCRKHNKRDGKIPLQKKAYHCLSEVPKETKSMRERETDRQTN